MAALGYDPDPDLDSDILNFPKGYLSPGNSFWVAEADSGRLVGIQGLLNGELRRGYVDPEFRRRGVVTALIRSALAGPFPPELREVFSIVARDNVAIQRALMACGFQRTDRKPASAKAAHCEIFILPLPSPS